METDFIYWRHPSPAGIKIEEISGAEDREQKVWIAMARQIYSENGKDGYREIGHYSSGAPFIEGENCRISLTHTTHFMAIATLPRTPEIDLEHFNVRTALGIDAEKADRSQAMRLRSKFLSDEEMALIAEDDVTQNILAWTIKEALFKAALTSGIDFKKQLRIISLPALTQISGFEKSDAGFGSAEILFDKGTVVPMSTCSWLSDGYVVTIAFSPKCAR